MSCTAQFTESVAANLSDEDLDDFCTASGAAGNNTVTEVLRMVMNPGYTPAARAFQVGPTSGTLSGCVPTSLGKAATHQGQVVPDWHRGSFTCL